MSPVPLFGYLLMWRLGWHHTLIELKEILFLKNYHELIMTGFFPFDFLSSFFPPVFLLLCFFLRPRVSELVTCLHILYFFHPLFTSWFSNFFALGSQVRLLWNNQMIEAFFAHAENKHSWLYTVTVTVTVLTTLPPPLLFYSFCYQKPKQREVKNTTRATANNLSMKHIKTTWILHLKTRGQRDICRSNLPAPPRPGLGE